MISVAEAENLIGQHMPAAPVEVQPTHLAQGRILREDLTADRDTPPYNRATMDGLALSSKAWNLGVRSFPIMGTAQAGQSIQRLADPETQGFRIMTGAMLPEGADAVIPVEDLDIQDETATVTGNPTVYPMRYVHPKGSDCPKGEVVLKAGTRLDSTHIAIAISMGYTELRTARMPSVAVISNGNELVDLGQSVAEHQIRPSNAYAIQADLAYRGFQNVKRFHYPDDPETLEAGLAQNLADFDILVLSGGVSMGQYDLIPQVLASLGATEVFHKVRQRPGKPLWFGIDRAGKPIFALPGNPVSTLTCFHRYVLPRLAHSSRNPFQVQLAEAISCSPNMTYFCPVALSAGCATAQPVQFNTSGDYLSLGRSDGFVECPEGQETFEAGASLRCWKWD